ncbi:pilus assembly protein N-terminal domain-containing protein [Aliidiomarina sanyensis]|uniref:Uncharacterized protein n=1 Tax=Aliidiomarina sanyensis TaxID=1249555 RepID=A0A432WET8_9GAMM|nr:pilus assembly protein N-terminal domain-containing protein [Aliidiomarina sanyensis]RUO31340.1 hypothetical protein CWE11_08315 [Aliidiomarina sanyensis]
MRTWMFSLCFLLTIGNALAQNKNNPQESLQIFEDRIHVYVPQHEVTRVAVAQPKRVDVQANADGELVVFPLSVGSTGVVLWHRDQSYTELEVTVMPSSSRTVLEHLEQIRRQDNELVWAWQRTRLFIDGVVSPSAYERLVELAHAYDFIELQGLTQRLETPIILELELHVVEVSRRFLSQSGLEWDTQVQGPSLAFVSDWAGSAALRRDVLGQSPEISSSSGYLGWAGTLSSTLQLLQERGHGRILATPRVRVENGESADFLVGGELPIPQTNAQGMMDVTFKPYGIRLEVQPELLADGHIRTSLFSEISHPDQSVTVQGVPGLRSRRATTQVVSLEGETAVIAGLVSSEKFYRENGLPQPKQVRIASRLTGQVETQNLDTELLIFVTAVDVAARDERLANQRRDYRRLQAKFMGLNCLGMVGIDHRFGSD